MFALISRLARSLKSILFTNHVERIQDGRIFSVDSQELERAVLWRLVRDPVFFTALCSDTWRWFAIEIPYDNQDGEIDILLCRPRNPYEQNSPLFYRGFQVKVSRTDRRGKESIKRANSARFRKALGQLKKLKEFGCDQVFFLEVVVMEHTRSCARPMSREFELETKLKADILRDAGVGYVIFPMQYRPNISEHKGGVGHFPKNVLPASPQKRSLGFEALAKEIDTAWESIPANTGHGLPVVTYCKSRKCRGLRVIHAMQEQLLCTKCGEEIAQA